MTFWGQQRPARRGSAPDLAAIVEAALVLADQDGVEAASLRRVATTLGSGTASFYRALESRDELIDRMIDAALGRHLPPQPTGEWHADLAAVARNRRAMLSAHPWLGTELAGRPAIGPNALIHHERALVAAAGYTDDPTAASSAVETVLAYVLGATARESAETRTEQRSGLTHEEWRTTVAGYLQQALDSGTYPHLRRMVHEAADLGPDERFERGLACVMTGLATLTSTPKTPRSRRSSSGSAPSTSRRSNSTS